MDSQSATLAGNIIGLLALVLNNCYEFLISRPRFEKEMAIATQTKDGAERAKRSKEAAMGKRSRADNATQITFAVLAFSYLLSILGAVK